MKTLFEIQTESGQLWIDIKSHLDALAADVSAANAETATAQAATQAAVDAAKAEAKTELDAAKAGFDAAKAAAQAEVQTARAFLVAVEAAIANPDLDDAATLAIAQAEVTRTKQTARQKERAELQAQRKQLDDRIAALND